MLVGILGRMKLMYLLFGGGGVLFVLREMYLKLLVNVLLFVVVLLVIFVVVLVGV